MVARWPLIRGGSASVDGAAVSEPSLNFAQESHAMTFAETGLPSGTNWSVMLSRALQSSTKSTITYPEPNGIYAFSVGSIYGNTGHYLLLRSIAIVGGWRSGWDPRCERGASRERQRSAEAPRPHDVPGDPKSGRRSLSHRSMTRPVRPLETLRMPGVSLPR